MRRLIPIVLCACLIVLPAPAVAQAVSFTLVNNTDIDFSALKIRRMGTQPWTPLSISPIPVPKSGGRGAVKFSNPDCAFDLEATLPDGRLVVWSGVNLCDTKVVTLNRNASGELWVDYD